MRPRANAIWLVLLLVLGAGAIGVLQKPLSERCARAKEGGDIYLLPPPDVLSVLTLGYRSATADVLWANLLVTQGFRTQQRVRYSNVVPEIEAIISLDPAFRDPYLQTDTLVTYQSVEAPQEDIRKVREILERGVAQFPLDPDMWLLLGEFTTFVAPPSYLLDQAEAERWRVEGLPYLERAVELSGANPNIAWQALGAGSHLTRAGERVAAIRFYQKVLATTEDEELQVNARQHLKVLLAEEEKLGASDRKSIADEVIARQARAYDAVQPAYRDVRKSDFTGLPRAMMLLMLPPRDAAACAGGASAREAPTSRCAPSWKEWSLRVLDERR
jgi:hypothetical protein